MDLRRTDAAGAGGEVPGERATALPPEPRLPDDVDAFVVDMPKVELHVHHVGSASPETVAQLAARHPEAGVPQDVDALREFFAFTDFRHFIEVYGAVSSLLRTPEDVRDLTWGVFRDLAAQDVRYAEVTVTPYPHLEAGIPPEAFLDAIQDARIRAARDLDLEVQWIFDIPGKVGRPADVTLDLALRHQPEGLVALGLGGPETPRAQFKPYFDQARAAGLASVPHAGEATGPANIWEALDGLGAHRVGHGTSSVQDPVLMERLRDHGIHLEVCLTSNVATRVVTALDEHPLRQMVDAGLSVSINSDDPPMFNTTLTEEYRHAARLLGPSIDAVQGLMMMAVDASFAGAGTRQRITDDLADVAARHRQTGANGAARAH